MEKQIFELQSLLKDARDITGISAEFLMTFLKYFDNEREKHLIYSLCCNFFRLEHSFEIELLNLGINTFGQPHSPDAFRNIGYVNVKIVEVIREYLKEKEARMLKNHLKY
ncbi:hypothetical protein [Aliikangiella coralliicola]|uniref:Uncharacterized protein n=1 Tax=Aliikangiella coralliicola TaxID=2592383 RepID=A0A545U759_9GAMM|nr:hypothetical protein [Aliikangiella coralliicola]TQV85315.1 hypothetical protein FLL46_19300 [Aliikangiella coralliicola]